MGWKAEYLFLINKIGREIKRLRAKRFVGYVMMSASAVALIYLGDMLECALNKALSVRGVCNGSSRRRQVAFASRGA
jgi:hypothetical protein